MNFESKISKIQHSFRYHRWLKFNCVKLNSEISNIVLAIAQQFDLHPNRPFKTKVTRKTIYELNQEYYNIRADSPTYETYRKLVKLNHKYHDIMKDIGNPNFYEGIKILCPNFFESFTCAEFEELKNWIKMLCPLKFDIEKKDISSTKMSIYFEAQYIPKIDNVGLQFEYEQRYAIMFIKKDHYVAKIGVLFHKDRTHVYRNAAFFQRIKKIVNENVSNDFCRRYLEQLPLKDFATLSIKDLCKKVDSAFKKSKSYQSMLFNMILAEMKNQRPSKKMDIIVLLLLSTDDKFNKNAELIIDTMLRDPKQLDEANVIKNSIDVTLQDSISEKFRFLKELRKKRSRTNHLDVPYETRIESMLVDDEIKQKAFQQLKTMKRSKDGDVKVQTYLDNLLRIPFGIYREEEIMTCLSSIAKEINSIQSKMFDTYESVITEHDIADWIAQTSSNLKSGTELKQRVEEIEKRLSCFREDKIRYMQHVRSCLDKSVYGHKVAKDQLERIVCQWITGKSDGMILGLQGPPGVGKTSIIKNGLSKCLVDSNGNERPFSFLPLGGLSGSSLLVGHNFTYQGSRWGRIAGILMDSKVMNPILFIDELDKVSKTERGEEIVGILTHLTDSTQNSQFYDRYFSGIPLDLSKVLIIFSFNDIDKIDRVLRDRITCIHIDPLDTNDKLEICTHFLLPDILNIVGFRKNDLHISNDDLRYIIHTFTFEAGVRRLKQILYHIVREYNRRLSYGTLRSFPQKLDRMLLNDILSTYHQNLQRKITDVPTIGVINGMYANMLGVGGITTIEVSKYRCPEKYGLKLTGQQGDVMRESMECAKTVAFNLLGQTAMNAYIANPHGLHIHCPEASVRKDGPSAGAAIAIAIFSYLSQIPIVPTMAITGEIDLRGNVRAVGGLQAKLHGVKRAGVTLALIPEENRNIIECLKKRNKLPVDDTFEIRFIKHVNEAIKLLCIE